MNLHERIAETLGWEIDDVYKFSLPTLREFIRIQNPKLAREITLVMNSPMYYMENLGTKSAQKKKI